MDNQKPDISPHLSEYYYILGKHKWIIIGSLIIMVTLTMFFTFRTKPVYRAVATIVVDEMQIKSPFSGQRIDFDSYVSQTLTFNTHMKLITSRTVLEEVIRRLKMDRTDKSSEISPRMEILARIKENIRLILDQEEKFLTPEEELTKTVAVLLKKIELQEVADTRLIKISVESHDPAMARNIANTQASVYIEFNIDSRLKSSKNTLSWMSDQLYEMKKNLEDSEEAFLVYKERESLFSVEGKQDLIARKISDFNDAQLEARNKRLEVEAKLQLLKQSFASRAGNLGVRSLIGNRFVDNLNTQLLDAEVELSRLEKVYKSKHPKIVQLRTKIDKTRKKLAQEIKKEIKSLQAERTVLLAREKAMGEAMADFEQEALATNRKEFKYSILQRNVETNQKLYNALLSKIKESNVIKDADVSNIRIVQKAVLPLSPFKPKKKLNFALSIIFGLMTGVGLAFLLEYMDRTLRTEEDVQRYLDLAVLSVVPEADKAKVGS